MSRATTQAAVPPADLELDALLVWLAGLFSALGEPSRLRLLRALCAGERAVGELAATTGVTRHGTSKHLQRLHGAGLLRRRRDGGKVVYQLADARLVELCRLTAGMLAHEHGIPVGRWVAGRAFRPIRRSRRPAATPGVRR